jgi:hypothetical protein
VSEPHVGSFRKFLRPAKIAAIVRSCRTVMARLRYPSSARRRKAAGTAMTLPDEVTAAERLR